MVKICKKRKLHYIKIQDVSYFINWKANTAQTQQRIIKHSNQLYQEAISFLLCGFGNFFLAKYKNPNLVAVAFSNFRDLLVILYHH